MRFLFEILIKNHVFIIFIFLAFFCISSIVKINPYHEFKTCNFIRNLMYNCFILEKNITDYFNLNKTNSELNAINIELIIDNESLIEKNQNLLLELKKHKLFQNSAKKRYNYIAATIEEKNWTLPNNIIILNKGKLDGIEKNMGVFNNNGVVGIVSHLTNHFCEVTTLIHQKTKLLTSIKTNNAILNEGLLKWNGVSYRHASIEGVGYDINIKVGDSVFTSINSTSFYNGIYIGKITNLEKKKSSNSFKIDILLGVDFKNINNALIIKDSLNFELNNFYDN